MSPRIVTVALMGMALLALAAALVPAAAQPADSLLVLDLDGDGLRLSDRFYPVLYDLDGDGDREPVSWTAARQNEAFLWIDRNGDGRPGSVDELVGAHRRLPDGTRARTGFDYLAAWDQPALGGVPDGRLTRDDALWARLGLWIDRDHDGEPQPSELSRPEDWGLFELSLTVRSIYDVDGGLNLRLAASTGQRRDPRRSSRRVWESTLVEVVFDRLPAARGQVAEAPTVQDSVEDSPAARALIEAALLGL